VVQIHSPRPIFFNPIKQLRQHPIGIRLTQNILRRSPAEMSSSAWRQCLPAVPRKRIAPVSKKSDRIEPDVETLLQFSAVPRD
jgi:hypothetical protein